MIEEKASAKVNLCLQILDQTPEGFHLLDSVVVFTEFGDDLLFEKSDKLELSICLLYTSPSPRDNKASRMPSSA